MDKQAPALMFRERVAYCVDTKEQRTGYCLCAVLLYPRNTRLFCPGIQGFPCGLTLTVEILAGLVLYPLADGRGKSSQHGIAGGLQSSVQALVVNDFLQQLTGAGFVAQRFVYLRRLIVV